MTEFREVRVRDLVATGALMVSDGYRVMNSELGSIGVPFVRGGDIGDGWINTDVDDHVRPESAERIANKVTQAGDVAFITKGSVGRVGRIRMGQPSVVFAPQVAWWRVLDRSVLDPTFVFYLLRGPSFQSSLYAVKTHGSMVADYVSIAQQLEFSLRVPPVAHQRRIAQVLGALDDKIELNRRTSETLEGTARALYKSWFLDSEVDASDWDGALADAVDLLRDVVDPQLEPDTIFQHYSLPAYDAGRKAIREPGGGIRSSKMAVPRGSVLLSKLNPGIERVWLPDIRPDDRAICSTEFLVLRPRIGVGRGFVYEFLRSAPFRNTLTSLVTGTTGSHQRAQAQAILQVRLRLPGPSRAPQFERLVGPMLDRIAVARRASRTLVALRDALLPRLLSGEASPFYGQGRET